MSGNERAAPPRLLSKEGEICAWHHATRAPVRLRWQQGKITSLEAANHEPPRSLWLAPPLVDLQINGFGGIDFQQEDLSVADLLTATRKLRAGGCLRFLLTLITNDWPKIMARLRHLRGLRAQSPELQSAIAGWHIEGPFLSAEPGYCGAHDPALMRDPTPTPIHELRDVTGDDPLLITIAPERRNAIAVISLAASLGITVSLGHTNAPRETLVQAVEAGASSFTHLGNACPQTLDRHDNILWRVFETPRLKVSLIPDAMHVSPALFRLIHRVIRADSIYYVSDAMAAAGSPPGRYKLGPLEVEVGEDKVCATRADRISPAPHWNRLTESFAPRKCYQATGRRHGRGFRIFLPGSSVCPPDSKWVVMPIFVWWKSTRSINWRHWKYLSEESRPPER